MVLSLECHVHTKRPCSGERITRGVGSLSHLWVVTVLDACCLPKIIAGEINPKLLKSNLADERLGKRVTDDERLQTKITVVLQHEVVVLVVPFGPLIVRGQAWVTSVSIALSPCLTNEIDILVGVGGREWISHISTAHDELFGLTLEESGEVEALPLGIHVDAEHIVRPPSPANCKSLS